MHIKTLNQHGYLMLETLLSVVIIAIIVMLFIPLFSTYLNKAKVAESLGLMSTFRQAVTEHYAVYGTLPQRESTLIDMGLKTQGQYTQNIEMDEQGAVTASFQTTTLENARLTMRPAIHADIPVLLWVCGNHHPPAPFSVQGKNQTRISPDLVPFSCRSRSK
ncbi:pilin [Candidatus Venteria ishoeyi]|uniref:type IV pilin protein n=1 Tax=Candidatus Venteria ishoeyi TaxID=1899563 RepID=UPI0025A55D11|nr:pilin [Candidatus Venteria ishoeyi]MDM8545134.1 pilin [Candidatus Venteria ishoeyi]